MTNSFAGDVVLRLGLDNFPSQVGASCDATALDLQRFTGGKAAEGG